MEDHYQFSLNCTTFTGVQLRAINLTRSITAMLCMVILALILLFLLCYKAYSTTFQRLYIYVIIATLFSEAIQVCGIEHQFHYEGQKMVCFWLGFITHWTSVMVFIFAFEIILYLFHLVITQVRQDYCCQPPQSKCCRALLELLFVLLPILLSFPIAWVPYNNNNYGLAGPWCWVRSIDDNCRSVGMRDQMIYFGLYWTVGAVGVIINLTFSVVYHRMTATFKEARKLLKLTLILMGFQLVYVLIVTLQLAVRMYTALTGSQQHVVMWYIHAFVIPNGQLIFPLGCLLCFYSVNKKLCGSIKKVRLNCMDWCKNYLCRICYKQRNGQPFNLQKGEVENATAPESNRSSPPSSTFFTYLIPDASQWLQQIHNIHTCSIIAQLILSLHRTTILSMTSHNKTASYTIINMSRTCVLPC